MVYEVLEAFPVDFIVHGRIFCLEGPAEGQSVTVVEPRVVHVIHRASEPLKFRVGITAVHSIWFLG